jgi:hypothetical protein
VIASLDTGKIFYLIFILKIVSVLSVGSASGLNICFTLIKTASMKTLTNYAHLPKAACAVTNSVSESHQCEWANESCSD